MLFSRLAAFAKLVLGHWAVCAELVNFTKGTKLQSLKQKGWSVPCRRPCCPWFSSQSSSGSKGVVTTVSTWWGMRGGKKATNLSTAAAANVCGKAQMFQKCATLDNSSRTDSFRCESVSSACYKTIKGACLYRNLRFLGQWLPAILSCEKCVDIFRRQQLWVKDQL